MQQERFDEFTKLLGDNISSQVIAAARNIKAELLKTMNSETHGLDERAFFEILSMKVDRMDFDRLNEQKSNKNETENMMDGVNVLNRQIQHLILILTEVLKMNIAQGAETKQQREHQSIQLLKQIKALTNWALKFDAKNKQNQLWEVD